MEAFADHRRMVTLLILMAAIALSACNRTKKENRILFDGEFFRTKSKKASDDRQSFTVRVQRADRSLAGAAAAGEHEGKNYCVTNFGTSDIIWAVDPTVDPNALSLNGNKLILEGRCELW